MPEYRHAPTWHL